MIEKQICSFCNQELVNPIILWEQPNLDEYSRKILIHSLHDKEYIDLNDINIAYSHTFGVEWEKLEKNKVISYLIGLLSENKIKIGRLNTRSSWEKTDDAFVKGKGHLSVIEYNSDPAKVEEILAIFWTSFPNYNEYMPMIVVAPIDFNWN